MQGLIEPHTKGFHDEGPFRFSRWFTGHQPRATSRSPKWNFEISFDFKIAVDVLHTYHKNYLNYALTDQ